MDGSAKKRKLTVFDIEAEQNNRKAKSTGSKPGAKTATGTAAVSAAAKSRTATGTKKSAASSKGKVQENPLARRSAVNVSPNRRPPQRSTAPQRNADARRSSAQPQRKTAARYSAQQKNTVMRRTPQRQTAPVRKSQRPDTHISSGRPPQGYRQKPAPYRRKKRGMSFMGVMYLLMILAGIGFGAWRVYEYQDFLLKKEVVSTQTFYAGTYVEGVDVSAMTLEDALSYWENNIEAPKRRTAVVLNDGTTITAEQMGYSSDYAQVLAGAWNAGRTGSLLERYERITQQSQGTREFSVSRTMYSEELIVSYVNAVGDQIDTDPVDAKLRSFNLSDRSFEFQSEQVGYTLNRKQLAIDIANGLSNGGAAVSMQVEAVAPTVTLENVQSQYGMITQAVTNASSSSSNRLNNIKVALSSINGTCLAPGESFSFNNIVGKRTEARGYKTATAYSGGTVTEEVGGGICQVSTTLFNAAVKADLKITERHSHSLTVSYVDVGKDAAVDWGNKDLKFTNTSDDDIYIICYLNSEKRVVVEIYGKKLADGVTITLEGKKTGSVDYETQYELNFNLTPGTTKVTQQGKNGTKAVAYKFWWDANGNEIKREQLCTSTYHATAQIIQYCP